VTDRGIGHRVKVAEERILALGSLYLEITSASCTTGLILVGERGGGLQGYRDIPFVWNAVWFPSRSLPKGRVRFTLKQLELRSSRRLTKPEGLLLQ
jgi:hypothetical protein